MLKNSELLDKVETLQNLLLAQTRGSNDTAAWNDSDYRELRAVLMQDADVQDLLPRFVRTCRDLKQFWTYIKSTYAHYSEREQFVHEQFAPLLDELESKMLKRNKPIPLQAQEDDYSSLKAPTVLNGIGIISDDKRRPREAISILFLAADPTDASRLRLGEEFREIQEKLQLAKLRGQFKLDQRMSLRPVDISQALLDVQPQIVHFSGHGTAGGALCFENQLGTVHPIQPDTLAALFEQFANQINCVILNACYSEIQAKAIAKHIDYVVGMNQDIGDKASISFSIGFYQALGAGRTIEESYKLGCVQIRLQGMLEYLTPVLIKKGQV